MRDYTHTYSIWWLITEFTLNKKINIINYIWSFTLICCFHYNIKYFFFFFIVFISYITLCVSYYRVVKSSHNDIKSYQVFYCYYGVGEIALHLHFTHNRSVQSIITQYFNVLHFTFGCVWGFGGSVGCVRSRVHVCVCLSRELAGAPSTVCGGEPDLGLQVLRAK